MYIPDTLTAILVQSRGIELQGLARCFHCAEAERTNQDGRGPFPTCVIVPGHMQGVCANCIHANRSCSLSYEVLDGEPNHHNSDTWRCLFPYTLRTPTVRTSTADGIVETNMDYYRTMWHGDDPHGTQRFEDWLLQFQG